MILVGCMVLERYLSEVGRYPVLGSDEEREVAVLARGGDFGSS